MHSDLEASRQNGFDVLFRSSPIATLLTSGGGTVVGANDAAARLFGAEREELVGRSCGDLVTLPDVQDEARARRKSGELRDVILFVERIELGGEPRATMMLVDITERKRTERRYRDMIEQTREGVVLIDSSGRYTFANRAAEQLLGLAPGEMIGRRVVDFIGADHVEQVEANLERRRRGIAEEGELKFRRADGADVWISFSSTPYADETGQLGSLSMVRDITPRKQAELKFRALLDAAPDAILIARNDGRIALVNAQASALFGYEPSELVGELVEKLVPERYRSHHPELRDRFFAAPTARPIDAGRELFGLRKDGTEFPAEISLSPIDTNEGILAVAAVRDITDRRALQARVALSDRLASVGTLAGGVAHEINNPLSVAMMNLELLSEELREIGGASSSERIRSLLERVAEAREGAERVRNIVRGLRIFSRASEERREIIELPRALEVAVNLASHEIRYRAKVVTAFGPTVPVFADESRVVQLFLNLLVNAAHAIPEGDVENNEIRVTTRTEGTRAVVEVSDTGKGIPPEALPRVFDPFFTTAPTGVGVGLGLAISHGIVTALGGEITAISGPGTGTTFRVALPGCATDRAKEGLRAPPPATAARKGRVLIVDDEPLVGASLARVLAEYQVAVVESAKAALERLTAEPGFDVIVCDLMMPEMTGMDLHAEIARRAPALSQRMVFITAGPSTDEARRFLDRVTNYRLEKPCDSQALRAIVGGLIAPPQAFSPRHASPVVGLC